MSDEPIDMYAMTMTKPPTVATERFQSERRQIGGLMLLLGTCAAFQPLSNMASLINADTARSHIEQASLAGGFFQVAFGGMAMMVGYSSLVHCYGNSNLSAALILLTQTAWIPYITDMVAISKDAFGDLPTDFVARIVGPDDTNILLVEYVVNPFIPSLYVPNERDVRFVGAMGLLGIMAYGVAFLGSLAFTEFTLYSFDMNKPMSHNAEYYRSRLLFYTFVLVLAGTSQLLLGAYSLMEFGNGPLEPPLVVAMYTISFPEIAIPLGIMQMLVGYFGIARYLGSVPVGPQDHEYQIMLLIQFIAMVGLQYLTQIGYASGDEGTAGAGAIISLVLLSVGLNVLPAFLDYKMRTMPKTITKEYFGITNTSDGANVPNESNGDIKYGREPEPLGGFSPPGDSVSSSSSSSSSVYLNDEGDIEEAIQQERKLGGDISSEEDNSGWEDTTDSSGTWESHPIVPKPSVPDDEEIVVSVPNEASDKDIAADSGKVQSAPMSVPVQMRDDDDDEAITPCDEDGEGDGRPPFTVEEEVIMPGDKDKDKEEVQDFIVEEEEVVIDDDGEVLDDNEQSQDPSEDNTPPASNQSKEWDDSTGWVDHESSSGSDHGSTSPIRKRTVSQEDPPGIGREGKNSTGKDASPETKLPNPESQDEVGVKNVGPEQVTTFSNSHHDEEVESDEDAEYANELNEIFSMIDPPAGRTPVTVKEVSYPQNREPFSFGEEDPPEVRTPVNVTEVSYPKYGRRFSFGENDIQDTASMVSMSGSDNSSEPGGDDSMSVLNQTLADIEKELFSHSMDAYNKSLEDIF